MLQIVAAVCTENSAEAQMIGKIADQALVCRCVTTAAREPGQSGSGNCRIFACYMLTDGKAQSNTN